MKGTQLCMTPETKDKLFAYVRVSSEDQNLDRQEERIAELGITPDHIFSDKASGKDTKGRPEFERMMSHLRKGDVVYCVSLDRWGRSLIDIRTTVDQLVARGVTVRFLNGNLVFTNQDKDEHGRDYNKAMNDLFLGILGSFAEFERSIIKSRQREGIRIAQAKGVYQEKCGRKPSLTQEQRDLVHQLVTQGRNKADIARLLKVSRETVYKVLREPKGNSGA